MRQELAYAATHRGQDDLGVRRRGEDEHRRLGPRAGDPDRHRQDRLRRRVEVHQQDFSRELPDRLLDETDLVQLRHDPHALDPKQLRTDRGRAVFLRVVDDDPNRWSHGIAYRTASAASAGPHGPCSDI